MPFFSSSQGSGCCRRDYAFKEAYKANKIASVMRFRAFFPIPLDVVLISILMHLFTQSITYAQFIYYAHCNSSAQKIILCIVHGSVCSCNTFIAILDHLNQLMTICMKRMIYSMSP